MPEQVKLLIMNIKSCEGFKVSVQLLIPFVGLALVSGSCALSHRVCGGNHLISLISRFYTLPR